MELIATAIALGLLAAASLEVDRAPHRSEAGCLSLNSGAADAVQGDVELYAADTAFRASHGVPAFPPDSAQFYGVGAACDSAAVTYRAWRVTQGDSKVFMPVTLVCLGAAHMLLGTALIARYVYSREHVVYDSIFTVKHVFTYQGQ